MRIGHIGNEVMVFMLFDKVFKAFSNKLYDLSFFIYIQQLYETPSV